nr:DUF3391 domain-containing protein [Burkholderiales bacterium]
MAQESLEVLTQDLLLGMFVEDLDRPWLDTPFLIQGFLLDDKHDIETLRQLCHHVYVDPLRSTVPVPRPQSERERPLAPGRTGAGVEPWLEVIRPYARSEVGGEWPAGDRAPIDDDDRVSSATPQRPREKITMAPGPKPAANARPRADWPRADLAQAASAPDSGASGVLFNPLSRLKGLFDGVAHAWRETRLPSVPLPDAADANRPDPSMAPPGVQLVVYPDERPIRDELPRAERSFVRARETLDRLAQDMRTSTCVDVAGVNEVVNDMVDSMIASPDALMWIARMRQQHSDVYSHGVQVGVYLLALGRHLG